MYRSARLLSKINYLLHINDTFSENCTFILMILAVGDSTLHFIFYVHRLEPSRILTNYIDGFSASVIKIANIQLLYYKFRIGILKHNIIDRFSVQLYTEFKIMIVVSELHARLFTQFP